MVQTPLHTEVGSGLNYKRKKFKTLLEQVHSGSISEVCVTHKDRLCRYGFELVEFYFQKAGCRIVVLNKDAVDKDSSTELAEDLLSVVNFFVARNNRLQAANKRKRRREKEERDKKEEEEEGIKQKRKTSKTSSRQDQEDSIVSRSNAARDSQ